MGCCKMPVERVVARYPCCAGHSPYPPAYPAYPSLITERLAVRHPGCARTDPNLLLTLPAPCLPQNGLLFGIPVVLDTDREDITVGDKVLVTYQDQNIAVVTIESKWTPNKPLECLKVYGTSSLEHPAVQVGGGCRAGWGLQGGWGLRGWVGGGHVQVGGGFRGGWLGRVGG